MKKFSKLLAVLVALAVIICPMTSAIVANATTTGTYSIVAEDANNVVLTIHSDGGFVVYKATVTFNNGSAFQSSYSSDGYTNGLKVIDYSFVSATDAPGYNNPAISAQASQDNTSLVLLVSANDAATMDLYSEIKIGIRVADGSTANLANIQAADDGDVTDDPTLLNFGSKVNASNGNVDSENNPNATTGESHTHNFQQTNSSVAVAATCTTPVQYYTVCSECGATGSTYAGSTYADHTPNVQAKDAAHLASAATCTADATYYYGCAVCGTVVDSTKQGYTGTWTDTGTATNHANKVYHAASAVSCTADGNTAYYSCSDCGKYFSDEACTIEIVNNSWVIAATGHTPVTDAAVAPTCTATGLTQGSHCSVCGAVITAQEIVAIDSTNHTNIVEDAAVAPTCVATGKTAGSHCADCGATIVAQETVAATGVHTYGEYVSDGNATCGADGTKTRTCSVCGATDTVTDTGSATGEHTYGAYVSDGNATCAADGTKTRTCSVCGATDTVTDTGSHSSVAHTYGAYSSNGDATCTVDGTKTRTCSVCGATDTVTDTGSATGHSWSAYTSNGDGTHTRTCSVCLTADTDDCDTEGADGACSVCGYKAVSHEHSYGALQYRLEGGSCVTYKACECGDETVVATVSNLSATPVLVVASGFAVRFRIPNTSLTGYTNVFANVTKDLYEGNTLTGVSTAAVIPAAAQGTKNQQFEYTGIASYELTSTIHFDVYGKDGSNNLILLSRRDYVVANEFKAKIPTAPSEEYRTFYADALRYGAASQTYFNYHTSNLADEGVTGTSSLPTEFIPVNDASGIAITPVTVVGNSVFYRFRVKKTAVSDRTLSNLSMTIDYRNASGVATTDTISGDQFVTQGTNWQVEFTNLPAFAINDSMTIKLYDGETEIGSLEYSFQTYANARYTSMLSAEEGTDAYNLGTLCQAVCAYGASAKSAFGA